MNTFEIYRWDSVTCSKDNTPKPMIYVKPDISLMNYFKRNNNKVWLKIKNSGSAYDNQAYYGIVEKSAYRPNYTPNYFNSKGMYVITLQTDYWIGYPTQNGQVEFLNGTVSVTNKEAPKLNINDCDNHIQNIIEDAVGKDSLQCKADCLEQCKAAGKQNCDSFCKELCTDGKKNKVVIALVVIVFILLLIYVINK